MWLLFLPGVVRAQGVATVHIAPRPLRTFVPAHALGAGVDGSDKGTVDRVFRPATLAAMRGLGFQSLTYRLRTELAIEAWHWNPVGVWSDAAGKQGYWTSAAGAASGPIRTSWGYRLPRRGSTIDQANDDGYSRLDDGDPATFWKSNPYLDTRFTHEPNALHPQWVVVDLGKPRPVDTIRLQWAEPFATVFRVEYCVTDRDEPDKNIEATFADGATWKTFPSGVVTAGRGGDATLRLTLNPVKTRFVRVWMTESSGVAPKGATDGRDGLGYALREIYVGQTVRGKLRDWIRHGPAHDRQSVVFASSVDPWHRPVDRDPNVEQPGFDTVAASGLANGMPILMPVSLVYDTPENAVALVQYLRARHIPVTQIEMGEEPDGQYIMPEDYGALYIQWADALHRVDPALKLGGPSFQTAVDGWIHWPDKSGDASWMHRFVKYLKARGHLADFAFFSFEWYPFDDLWKPAPPQMARHRAMLDYALDRLVGEGLPRDIPWMISEYGWSPFATRDEVTLPAALLNAEIVGQFLTRGGDVAYLYGWEPGSLNLDKSMKGATWGNLLTFLSDDEGNITHRLPAYYAGRLIAGAWADETAPDKPHTLYRATVTGASGKPDETIAAYPLRRPSGVWSILLINKSDQQSRPITLRFDGPTSAPLSGPLTVWHYGAAQYAWRENGSKGKPHRSLPPSRSVAKNGPVTLPPFSLTVIQCDGPM